MNKYTLSFQFDTGRREEVPDYVEEIHATLDSDAIELADARAQDLCDGDWKLAILYKKEVGIIWMKARKDCRD